MADEIKLNYPMAEEMIKAFKEAGEQIQDTIKEVLAIAQSLEDGALRGRAGEVFVDGLRNQFVPALGRLNGKFDELADDVAQAVEYMKAADAESVRLQSN